MTATATDFVKVCRVGTIPNGRTRADVFIKIECKDGRLSFSGVIGPRSSGNCLGSCGQIVMGFAHRNAADNDHRYTNPTKPSEFNFAPGWNAKKWLDLIDAWERWHLNDMKAGSPAQEEWLRAHPVNAVYPKSHYEEASKALEKAGLNPDPTTGYKYGHAWMREEIPGEVLAKLAALPDADQTPAWC